MKNKILEKKSIATLGSSVVFLIALLLISQQTLSSSTVHLSTSNAIISDSTSPEVFTISSESHIITPEEFEVDIHTTVVEPVTRNIESNNKNDHVANFMLQSVPEAFALSPNNNSATITEWTFSSGGIHWPSADVSNNVVWVAEWNVNKIARLNMTSNQVTEWAIPTPNSGPYVVLFDANTGMVYFLEHITSKIGRLDPATNGITEWFLPHGGQSYFRLVLDDRTGELYTWADNQGSGYANIYMVKLNPNTNTITNWLLDGTSEERSGGNLQGLAIDSTETSTAVYYTEGRTNTIDRLIVGGSANLNQLTKWTVPQPSSSPANIAVDADGAVFFSQGSGNRIARLIPQANQITQWVIPTPNSNPFWMTADSTGTVYFSEYNTNKIGRLVPSTGVFTEWNLPSANSRLADPSVDSLGNVYFAEEGPGNKIARLS